MERQDRPLGKGNIIWAAACDVKGLYFKDPCQLIPSDWSKDYYTPAGNQTLRWAQPKIDIMWLSMSLKDIGFKSYKGVIAFSSYNKKEVQQWIDTIQEYRAVFLIHMKELLKDVRSIHNNVHRGKVQLT